MNDDIKPLSDDEFKRAQRLADAKQQRELKAKMQAKPLEQIIETFATKVEVDPTTPLGKCERCGAPFEQSDTGRLKDHVCADRAAAIAAAAATQRVTPAERAADRAVDRIALGIRRVRRDDEDRDY